MADLSGDPLAASVADMLPICCRYAADMLVYLTVWMASGAETVAGMIVAMTAPVTLFVVAGFQHSVANMALLRLGWALDPAGVPLAGIAHNLALSTLGNLIGGGAIALLLGAGHGALKHR